ncbi:hypothetical protein K4L44_06045 [Halosquirtibacter laminarini]|uniref:Uncharacterized protein n=1 Tax=Halosquirtibacter laminarini TaxID=3374600 RepID=A0AC61NP08_9BACT|nr:hypothetical protein K4L44_06045 [Prolixibacteraceae bacterium]
MKNILLLITLLLTLIKGTNGQSSYNYGGYPIHHKWKYIENNIARIVYPEGLKETAERALNIITYIDNEQNLSVGTKKKKINILINNSNGISNGYVSVFPFQSELYTLAPQDLNQLGATEWMDQLSIHEFRHVQQYVNMKQNVVQLASLLTGDYGWVGVSNLIFPKWYFEGDAVVAETALSDGGRGRLPYFFKEQRALCLDSIQYGYRKLEQGSLKDIVPSYYNLGYNMVREGREIAGPNVWSEVLKESVKFKISNIYYPFARGTKAFVGLSTHELYKEVNKKQNKLWRQQWSSMRNDSSKSISLDMPKNKVAFYQYPQIAENNTMYVVKSSFDKTSEIIKLTNYQQTKEEKITSIGITQSPSITYNNYILSWIETVQNPLFKEIRKQKIVIFDLSKNHKKVIGKPGYYFSPQVNHEGTQLMVVEKTEKLHYQIVIFDIKTEKIIQTIPNPDNFFVSQPQWATNDQEIFFISKKNHEISIQRLELANLKATPLVGWTKHVISGMDVDEKHLYFGASFSGIDQIYSVSLEGKARIRQHTNDKIGAYYPTVDPINDTLVYSNFTSKGYRLRKIAKNNFIKELPILPEKAPLIGGSLVKNDEEEAIEQLEFEKSYKEHRYIPWTPKLRPYAWSVYIDNNYFGAQILTTNLFNNFYANIGYKYSSIDEEINFNGEVIYARLPIKIKLRGEMVENQLSKEDPNSYEDYRWIGEASLPIRWVTGNYLMGTTFSADYTFHQLTLTKKNIEFTPKTYHYQISFYAQHQRAKQNLYPKLGQSLSFNFQDIKETENQKIWTFMGTTYLPGLFPNQGLKLDYGYQNLSPNLILNDYFNYSRGYSQRLGLINNTRKFGATYAFPLLYPDLGIFGITYIKRIWGTLFYDFQVSQLDEYITRIDNLVDQNRGTTPQDWYNEIAYGQDIQNGIEDGNRYFQRSIGAELYMDMNVFNSSNITIGSRISYLVDKMSNNKSNYTINFILSKNF